MGNNENITTDMLAKILIQAGSSIVLPAYQSNVQTTTKVDGSVVTETDLASQHYIQNELQTLDRNIAFLGEEMSEDEQLECLRASGGSYWCLDPLDGTTNFATSLPGFAISLALIKNGQVELACIHDPVRGETFTASRNGGAKLNGVAIHASSETETENAVGYIDFKRLSPATTISMACDKIYRSQRNIGSCALEWAWLAAGRGQFIIHGGEKIWDFAAGSLIATEAGCFAGNFSGAPFFPATSLSSPVLAACSTPVHETLKMQLSH